MNIYTNQMDKVEYCNDDMPYVLNGFFFMGGVNVWVCVFRACLCFSTSLI